MDGNGFFMEAHAKLRPSISPPMGSFCRLGALSGHGHEACSQGLGASSRAATVLFKDKLVTSAIVAEINELTCVGCQGCLEIVLWGH